MTDPLQQAPSRATTRRGMRRRSSSNRPRPRPRQSWSVPDARPDQLAQPGSSCATVGRSVSPPGPAVTPHRCAPVCSTRNTRRRGSRRIRFRRGAGSQAVRAVRPAGVRANQSRCRFTVKPVRCRSQTGPGAGTVNRLRSSQCSQANLARLNPARIPHSRPSSARSSRCWSSAASWLSRRSSLRAGHSDTVAVGRAGRGQADLTNNYQVEKLSGM